MKKILIYSSNICPYCIAAKNLLATLNLSFEEKLVDDSEAIKSEMLVKSGGKKTVPQIFFGQLHIGGYDDLNKIHKTGQLMSLLNEK